MDELNRHMVFITISGKAKHGKDSLASFIGDFLREEGKTYQILSVADSIKSLAFKKGWNGKKDNNGRVLLQFIGTEYGIEFKGQYYWVKKLIEKINPEVDCVIIPDCRYNHEATFFQDHGFKQINVKVVRLKSDGTPYESNLSDKQKKHPSENGIKDSLIHYDIKCSTLECLRQNAELISWEVS